MKRAVVAGLVAVLTIGLAIEWASAKGDAAKGKAAFDQLCASCHGAAGKGDGPAAAALTPKARNLTDKAYMSGLKEAYLENMRCTSSGSVSPTDSECPIRPRGFSRMA